MNRDTNILCLLLVVIVLVIPTDTYAFDLSRFIQNGESSLLQAGAAIVKNKMESDGSRNNRNPSTTNSNQALEKSRSYRSKLPISSSSRHDIDIIGIKLGETGPSKSIKIIEKAYHKKLTQSVYKSDLRLNDFASHPIPNTNFYSAIYFPTEYDEIFAAPPNKNVVLIFNRYASYKNGPLLKNMKRSLLARYGKSNYSFDGNRATFDWIWSSSGRKIINKSTDMACTNDIVTEINGTTQINKSISDISMNRFKKSLNDGCYQILSITLGVDGNGIVSDMDESGVDVYKAYKSILNTSKFVHDYKIKYNSNKVKNASNQALPSF